VLLRSRGDRKLPTRLETNWTEEIKKEKQDKERGVGMSMTGNKSYDIHKRGAYMGDREGKSCILECLWFRASKKKETAEHIQIQDLSHQQNVRLLGCECKTCKTCDNCCCSTRLVAPTKTNLEREKGTTLFVTLQHWLRNKTSKHKSSICQDQPIAISQRGGIIIYVFRAHEHSATTVKVWVWVRHTIDPHDPH